MPLSPSDLLQCALDAARAAGDHALRNAHRRHEVAERFTHDVKLNLDFECQRKAEEVIRGAYPDHGVLGEEGGSRPAGDVPVWILDPIDGTVNFSHGIRLWCSSVAVEIGGRIEAGVVYAPALGEVYAGARGLPSTLNGKHIRVSDTRDAAHALVLTGIEKTYDAASGAVDQMRHVALNVQKLRILGAAALDLCQVASGRADAFFESGIHIWDLAAGWVIIEEAGGRVEKLALADGRIRYLATNGHLHEAMKRLLADGDGLPATP